MAGRAAIMLALGIPVAAGLLYLVLGSAPLAYPLANALALLIAVPIAAFAPLIAWMAKDERSPRGIA